MTSKNDISTSGSVDPVTPVQLVSGHPCSGAVIPRSDGEFDSLLIQTSSGKLLTKSRVCRARLSTQNWSW